MKIAYEYRRAYKNIIDLVQEGNIGLMQAVKRYDPYRGVKLSSYAAVVDPRVHPAVHPQQLAPREARHDAGAAQALLQPAKEARGARRHGHRAERRRGRQVAQRAGERRRRDGACAFSRARSRSTRRSGDAEGRSIARVDIDALDGRRAGDADGGGRAAGVSSRSGSREFRKTLVGQGQGARHLRRAARGRRPAHAAGAR